MIGKTSFLRMNNYVRIILTIGFFLALIGNATSQEKITKITIGTKEYQEIEGWGFSPAPIDWDGNSMLRSQTMQNRLYSDTKVDVVRILFGAADIYDDEKGAIKTQNALILIRTELAVFKGSCSPSYIISILTPPPSMKAFNSSEGHVDMVENTLRIERQDDFAKFVAQFISLIRQEGIPVPKAISIQSRPDAINYNYGCPPTTAQGCPYSFEQYIQLCKKVKVALRDSGFGTIQLAGPEIGGLWSKTSPSAVSEGIANIIDVPFFHSTDSFSGAIFLEKVGLPTLSDTSSTKNIWIIAHPSVESATESDQMIAAFRQLGRDLTILRATLWFWPYGFTWEKSAESLRSGRQLNPSLLCRSLESFWHSLPRGAKVRDLEIDDQTLRTSHLKGKDAFSFGLNGRALLVLINGTMSERQYSLSNLTVSKISIFQKMPDTQLASPQREVENNTNLKMPPQSVGIVLGTIN